jgi:hypothetical protein
MVSSNNLSKDSEKILVKAKLDKSLEESRAEGSLFSITGISEHLEKLGYPERGIDSIARCQETIGNWMVKECGCGSASFQPTWACDLRICPSCGKKRQRRMRKKYLPMIDYFCHLSGPEQIYFLTISPKNYSGFKEGMNHIKKCLKKFVRRKYVKERIKGYLAVIETKDKGKKGWNIHVHMIYYGRRLDNVVRGKCLDCGQNHMKKVYFEDQPAIWRCANKKCHSSNISVNEDSKIVQIWKNISKRPVNIDIKTHSVNKYGSKGSSLNTNPNFVLNYMLKYITLNKEEFSSPERIAKYIVHTRKQKLVYTGGVFYTTRNFFPQMPCNCYKCGRIITYIYDYDISRHFEEAHAERLSPHWSGLQQFLKEY